MKGKCYLQLGWLSALVAALAFSLTFASPASANPSEFQRFEAGFISNDRAGSARKPAAVGLYVRPYHLVGLEGGKNNAGGLNSGAVMESPAFSTKFANVWLPKQLKFNLDKFPGCDYATILGYPDQCPKGSEVGLKNKDPKCGEPGRAACTIYATGLVRNQLSNPSSQSIAGIYVLPVTLAIRLFVAKNDEQGRKARDLIGLRVISPVSGNVIIPGRLSRASGAQAKSYGYRMRFTIPRGLVSPTEGLVSQLTDFSAGIAKVSYKRRPMVGLTSCPKSRKLLFGYNGEYVINAQRNLASKSPDDEFVIGEVGPVISQQVRCR